MKTFEGTSLTRAWLTMHAAKTILKVLIPFIYLKIDTLEL